MISIISCNICTSLYNLLASCFFKNTTLGEISCTSRKIPQSQKNIPPWFYPCVSPVELERGFKAYQLLCLQHFQDVSEVKACHYQEWISVNMSICWWNLVEIISRLQLEFLVTLSNYWEAKQAEHSRELCGPLIAFKA